MCPASAARAAQKAATAPRGAPSSVRMSPVDAGAYGDEMRVRLIAYEAYGARVTGQDPGGWAVMLSVKDAGDTKSISLRECDCVIKGSDVLDRIFSAFRKAPNFPKKGSEHYQHHVV
eukprot:gene35485-16574_t